MRPILIVNFGGPRNLDEIAPFLRELLCDKDVVRTRFPTFIHNLLFTRIANKRAKSIRKDYAEIGGRSPIYEDTETIAKELRHKLQTPVYTFHRYLPATHAESIQKISLEQDLITLPLFPQFSYATTGSIARFLSPHTNLNWIKSYPDHPAFIKAYQRRIKEFLKKNNLQEEETILFFSAHGLPKKFVDEGDPYESECKASFNAIKEGFPLAKGRLCYQSKFGKGEWLRPYTDEACEDICTWHEKSKNIVFIPMSFTSDHIETLFEIEKLYLPIITKNGLNAYRCPALNLEPYWIDALCTILQDPNLIPTEALIRK